MKIRRVFACVQVFLAGCAVELAVAETLHVPSDFSTIQAAIDAAVENDVVLVEPGRYTENLTLRSGVEVVGVETARTLLGPDDSTLPTVAVADAVGLRFSNFTLIDSTTGVSVLRSVSVDITNVVFDRASEIGLATDASNVEIVNNVFFGNETAISRGTAAGEIVNNIFAGNTSAIVTTGGQTLQNVQSNCFFDNDDLPSDADGQAGAGAVFGDPLFVAPDARDFHLREGSACIDIGRGLDAIDDTAADAGAYGGESADPFPFPVAAPTLSPVGSAAEGFGIDVSWIANESYLVTSSTNPGGYRVYYVQGPLPDSPDDYNGDDAANGPSPIDVGPVTQIRLEGLDAAVTPPLAPRLIDAQGRNEAVVLEWEAVPDAEAYRVHYGVASVDENRVDVPAGTEHVVTGLVNGTTYQFAVSAVDRATYHVAVSVVDNTPERHESVLSPPTSVMVGDEAESPLSSVLSATPVTLEAFPPLADGDSCFIATAAFGSKHAADVEILRAFRDRFLSTHAAGRWLVERYYAVSPPAARWLERHAGWKPIVRMSLKPFVIVALVAVEGGAIGIGALVAALAVALVGAWRVRAARGQRLMRVSAARGQRRMRGRGGSTLVAVVCVSSLALAGSSAFAQGASSRPDGQPVRTVASPRWMYAITGGYAYSDLDDYARFYGDDRDTSFAVAGAFRLRDRLEIGGRVAFNRDEGIAITADGSVIPDAVELTLVPLHVFADFIFERPDRRLVPYAGLGIGGTWYRQEIELQPDVDGRTDIGPLLRAGVRWRFSSSGSRETAARPGGPAFMRSFVLLEVEHFDSEADGVELGGTAYRVGVRFEFEL